MPRFMMIIKGDQPPGELPVLGVDSLPNVIDQPVLRGEDAKGHPEDRKPECRQIQGGRDELDDRRRRDDLQDAHADRMPGHESRDEQQQSQDGRKDV